MKYNDDGISPDPVLVPPHQIVNRLLPVPRYQFFLLHNDPLMLRLSLDLALHRSLLLHLVPIMQFRLVLCQEVLFGPLMLSLFLDLSGHFDNISAKVHIFRFLGLLNHSSQICEVLL